MVLPQYPATLFSVARSTESYGFLDRGTLVLEALPMEVDVDVESAGVLVVDEEVDATGPACGFVEVWQPVAITLSASTANTRPRRKREPTATPPRWSSRHIM